MMLRSDYVIRIIVAIFLVAPFGLAKTPQPRAKISAPSIVGQWEVQFTLHGVDGSVLVTVGSNGRGWFRFPNTKEMLQPAGQILPAVWSSLPDRRVSFSGEAELPLGTCCRERGTLLLKGRFSSPNTISGKLVFVTSVDEDESPYKLRSEIGVFSATRIAH
jgi:hypothetical protein